MVFFSNLLLTLSRVSRRIRRIVSGAGRDEAQETTVEIDFESKSIIGLCEQKKIPIVSSESSASPTSVKFTNKTSKIIETGWINYRGEDHLYTTISPRETYTQHTSVDHPWTFKVNGALGRLVVDTRLVRHVYSNPAVYYVTEEHSRTCLLIASVLILLIRKTIVPKHVIWRSSVHV